MSVHLETLSAFIAAAAAEPWRGRGERVVVLGSGARGAGCSTTAALLALACATESRRTLLVDGADDDGPLRQMIGGGLLAAVDALRGGDPEIVLVDAGSRLETLRAAAAGAVWRFLVIAGAEPASQASSYALVKAIDSRWPGVPIDILINRQDDRRAHEIFQRMRSGVDRFLGRAVRFAGAIPEDQGLRTSALAGEPLTLVGRRTHAGLAAHVVAARLLAELDEGADRTNERELLERRP